MDSIFKVAKLVDAGNKKQQKDLESLSLEVDLIKNEYEGRIAMINNKNQDLQKKTGRTCKENFRDSCIKLNARDQGTLNS